VNLERFLTERETAWRELEELVRRARRRPERLGPEGVLRLGTGYRAAAADLALARRRFPGDPVVARLEQLVGRARHLVYAAPSRRVSAWQFFAHGYWRLVVERRRAVAVAAALLFAPALLAGAWALDDPGAAGGLVPPEYAAVTEPRPEGSDVGTSPEEDAAVASAIFTNNIRVALLAFAGGIAAGLLTALVLVYNGVLIGAIAGLAASAGNGRVFYELVVAHGVLELSCIAVTAGAGLQLGMALVEPGRKTRVQALVAEARRAIALVLGTAPWFVVAGIVEGFVTGSGAGIAAVTAVGFGLAAVYWTLVVLLGRSRGEPEPSL
jgi:uncharacterized membrane protein SpoIIM required for sporulation